MLRLVVVIFVRCAGELHEDVLFHHAAHAQVDDVADHAVQIRRRYLASRRTTAWRCRRCPVQGAQQVVAPRPGVFAGVHRRDELELAEPIVARVRHDPRAGRPAAVAGQAVTVDAVIAIDLAADGQRLEGVLPSASRIFRSTSCVTISGLRRRRRRRADGAASQKRGSAR